MNEDYSRRRGGHLEYLAIWSYTEENSLTLSLPVQDPTAVVRTREILDQMVKSREAQSEMGPS